MMMPPKPTDYRCPSCGWQKTVSPTSNPLDPEPRFDACPRCGHRPLEKNIVFLSPSPMGGIMKKIKDWLS